MIGSGDFSIGSKVWPGTSKLLEEMGELQQVLGKLIAVAGSTEHWDGDLRSRLIEECADVAAALQFFTVENFTRVELLAMLDRSTEKKALFRKWHAEPEEKERIAAYWKTRGRNDKLVGKPPLFCVGATSSGFRWTAEEPPPDWATEAAEERAAAYCEGYNE